MENDLLFEEICIDRNIGRFHDDKMKSYLYLLMYFMYVLIKNLNLNPLAQ
jgi:hypothetical protein